MFERYTEKARRVIFFARYEASQFGSPYIETEHLLLGLLREDKACMGLSEVSRNTQDFSNGLNSGGVARETPGTSSGPGFAIRRQRFDFLLLAERCG